MLSVVETISILLSRYEVNFQKGLSCGGAYLKLLSDEADPDLVN